MKTCNYDFIIGVPNFGCYGYLCDNRTSCFPYDYVCDGYTDCLDGSDEGNCCKKTDNTYVTRYEKSWICAHIKFYHIEFQN